MTEINKEKFEALVGTCHVFKVGSVDEDGAFLDCRPFRGLFVPAAEQKQKMKKGDSCIVYVYRNEKTGVIEASSKLDKYMWEDAPEGASENDAVDLLIYVETDMGYKAVVNNDCWGLLYKNEVFQKLECGQRVKGFIKKIREDGRIDLCLHKPGYQHVGDLSSMITEHLKVAGGSSPLTDKTPPEEIYRLFGVSKKKFKMAVGNLYRKRLIIMEPDGISLAPILFKEKSRGMKR